MKIENNNEITKKQKPVVMILKAAVTFALFYWVLAQVEIDPLLGNFKNADIGYLFLALVIHAIAFILFSIRWWYLYYIQDPNWSYKHTVGSYYLGLFFNNILPTGIGGDVVRIIRLRKTGLNTHLLVSSTLLDRILGLVSILLMGLVAVVFTPNLKLSVDTKILLVMFGITLAVGLRFLFSDYIARLAESLHNKFKENKIFHFIFTIISTLHEYRKKRTQILFTLFISFMAQYLIILCFLLIGISLNIEIPVSIYFTIIPIVFVATSLPISIGGLGVRESVLIYLLVFFQADKQAAIALSLIYFATVILITLPGSLVILHNSKKAGANVKNALQERST
jgi:uncharacterized protein (TIRG00374 family)